MSFDLSTLYGAYCQQAPNQGKHSHITLTKTAPPSGFYTILQSLEWMDKTGCFREYRFQSPKKKNPKRTSSDLVTEKFLMSASPEAPRSTIWIFLYLNIMEGGHMPSTWTAVKTVIFGSRMTCGWHVHMCKCVEYWHIRVHCSWTIYWWLRGFKIESIWKKKQPRVYLGKSRLIHSVQHVN